MHSPDTHTIPSSQSLSELHSYKLPPSGVHVSVPKHSFTQPLYPGGHGAHVLQSISTVVQTPLSQNSSSPQSVSSMHSYAMSWSAPNAIFCGTTPNSSAKATKNLRNLRRLSITSSLLPDRIENLHTVMQEKKFPSRLGAQGGVVPSMSYRRRPVSIVFFSTPPLCHPVACLSHEVLTKCEPRDPGVSFFSYLDHIIGKV